MRPLLKPAQVERVIVLVAYQEPEHLGVELAALGEVARGEGRVAGAQEAEWRVQVRLRYGHRFSTSFRTLILSSISISFIVGVNNGRDRVGASCLKKWLPTFREHLLTPKLSRQG